MIFWIWRTYEMANKSNNEKILKFRKWNFEKVESKLWKNFFSELSKYLHVESSSLAIQTLWRERKVCVHTVEIRDESDQVHSCLRKFSFALFTLRFVTVFLYSFLICPLYSRGFSHYLSIYFFICLFLFTFATVFPTFFLSFHSTKFSSFPLFLSLWSPFLQLYFS